MTRYSIEFKQSAKKELAQLPRPIAEKVAERIKALADNPRPDGCKKLSGSTYSYRIRINDYRVVYSIIDQCLIIQVIKMGHRKDVYQ
ncbi:MAG: type II toxin-antitoxin system RelE/ParE family toxin [Methylococcaceae bacterium]